MMNIQPLTYRKFIIGILVIVIILFIFKLCNTVRKNGIEEFENIENFESILNKLKSNNKKKYDSGSFQRTNNVKLKKKASFEDLIKETEDMDVDKFSVSNIKKNIFGYIDSFRKEKFKNTTGTTTEALEKFGYFKEKFFEIFI
jgi:Fe-S oxidoreductase